MDFQGVTILFFVLFVQFQLYENISEFVITNKVRFPDGSPFMGIFVAVAVPLDLPQKTVFMSVHFEAIYSLPSNQTRFVYPPIIPNMPVSKRSVDRNQIYAMLQNRLLNYGYPGKPCLLRTICEIAQSSMEENGVLGDILQIILKPSASTTEEKTEDYHKAEIYGTNKKHCKKYIKKCPKSVLDLFTTLEY